ncbi:MAG: helix-turn-helix domain-containing protein [Lachnospiraceae bacterium]|nr:helix-turn-helix domain-containing protein [Lachnospiraceae bacterium]
MKKLMFDAGKLRELIRINGKTYVAQAKEAGLSRSSFLGIASGQMTPKLETISLLADYYGVEPLALIWEDER